jgi:hypothetical protein
MGHSKAIGRGAADRNEMAGAAEDGSRRKAESAGRCPAFFVFALLAQETSDNAIEQASVRAGLLSGGNKEQGNAKRGLDSQDSRVIC